MPDIDYYEDPSQWGNYQYDRLEDIVNNYIGSMHQDDYNSTTPRYKMLIWATLGVRELYFDVLQEIKAIELELSPAQTVIMPPDFVNYVRISWVDECGRLHPMAMNPVQNIAVAYLQDHQYNLLYDDEGCVLMGSGVRDDCEPTSMERLVTCREFCWDSYGGYSPNTNRAYNFPNGSYRVDKSNGVIEFGSNARGKNIVLEYISDGLWAGCHGIEEGEVRIHKFASQALRDFIHYESVKNRRNVPAVEKQRAAKEYDKSRRVAKRRINTLRKTEILQAFKGATRAIR